MATSRRTLNQTSLLPAWRLLALEFRAPLEFGALLPAWPALQRGSPRATATACSCFPACRPATRPPYPLRGYLGSLGYAAEGWSQGFNFGPRAGVLEAARRGLGAALCEASGRKVSLIGWSLGGVYARELAKEMPQHGARRDHAGLAVRGSTRSPRTPGASTSSPAGATSSASMAQLRPARGAARAHDQHLLAQRRHRGLARQHPAARPTTRDREHRGASPATSASG